MKCKVNLQNPQISIRYHSLAAWIATKTLHMLQDFPQKHLPQYLVTQLQSGQLIIMHMKYESAAI